MLAVRGVSSYPYGVVNSVNNKKPEQPITTSSVNFTGNNQKSSKFTSYASGVIMGLLSLFGLSACGGGNSDKYSDVYITYNDLPECSDTIKMENGCSFEVVHTKYVMHEGDLWAYDKDKHRLRKTPDNVMVLRSSQGDDLMSIARACDEEEGVSVLSKEDIKRAMENNQDFEYDMLCTGKRDLTTDGDVLKVKLSYGDYVYYTLKFKYDDKDLKDKN